MTPEPRYLMLRYILVGLGLMWWGLTNHLPKWVVHHSARIRAWERGQPGCPWQE